MEIPKKMKAAVLFGKNDLRVVQKDVPWPGPGEVLIKVKTCAKWAARFSGISWATGWRE